VDRLDEYSDEVFEEIYEYWDKDNSKKISKGEMKAFIDQILGTGQLKKPVKTVLDSSGEEVIWKEDQSRPCC